MEGSELLSAFNEGQQARRDGVHKRFNPYLVKPNHQHLKRTWEGGWEFEAHSEGCTFSVEIETKQFQLIEDPFLKHIFRFVQQSIELDEEAFLEELQSLTANYLPERMVRITVILPKNEPSQLP